MCHALLTTCRHCTWILSITYPRCSHAKAYAIPPPSCPHRMARRYKPSGLCSACKPPPLSPPDRPSAQKPRRHEEAIHRKDSLSITPCAVRIAFRDTQLGAVAEADKPRDADSDPSLVCDEVEKERHPEPRDDASGRQIEHQHHIPARTPPTHEARPLRRTHARARARAHRHHAHLSSLASESDVDADAYIASPSPSPSPSVSSSTSTSPVPTSLPRLYPLKKPRRRSPGVLERIAMAKGARAPVKKGRRGRPPKRKVEWPDRVDAGAWEEVVREREAKAGGKGGRVVRRKHEVGEGLEVRLSTSPGKMGCERDGGERRTASRGDMERGVDTARGTVTEMEGEWEMCGGSVVGEGFGEGENIAHSIVLEAAQREKKWR